MTLHGRITAALDAIPGEGNWRWTAEYDRYSGKWGVRAEFEPDEFVTVAQHVPLESETRLIAAAPGLLAECARRLDPGDTDIAHIVRCLLAPYDHGSPKLTAPHYVRRAADLLAQAFLDPQETDQ